MVSNVMLRRDDPRRRLTDSTLWEPRPTMNLAVVPSAVRWQSCQQLVDVGKGRRAPR
jgi:hypothetical protein